MKNIGLIFHLFFHSDKDDGVYLLGEYKMSSNQGMSYQAFLLVR